MIVRIRFQSGPRISRKERKNQHVALALGALLTPVAVTAVALGCWRLASDLRVAGQFVIKDGLFSHWQVWVAAGGLVQTTAVLLNRYGSDKMLFRNAEEKPQDPVLDSGY